MLLIFNNEDVLLDNVFFVTIVKKEFSDIFLIYPPQLSNLEHNYLGICSLQLNRQLILFLREAAIRTVDFDECTFEQNNKNSTPESLN